MENCRLVDKPFMFPNFFTFSLLQYNFFHPFEVTVVRNAQMVNVCFVKIYTQVHIYWFNCISICFHAFEHAYMKEYKCSTAYVNSILTILEMLLRDREKHKNVERSTRTTEQI